MPKTSSGCAAFMKRLERPYTIQLVGHVHQNDLLRCVNPERFLAVLAVQRFRPELGIKYWRIAPEGRWPVSECSDRRIFSSSRLNSTGCPNHRASTSPRAQVDETGEGVQLALDVGAAGAEDDAGCAGSLELGEAGS